MNLTRLILPSFVAINLVTYNANSEEPKKTNLEVICKRDRIDTSILIKNYHIPRQVSVVVALDRTNETLAKELIDSLNYNYATEFNISFKPILFFNYSPKDSLVTETEFKKIKKASGKQADIYFLFTSTDWQNPFLNKKNRKKFPLYGEASPYFGFAWIKTFYNKKICAHSLVHEVGHLFGAEHEDSTQTIMHPSDFYDKITWSNETLRIILENKFRKWGGIQ